MKNIAMLLLVVGMLFVGGGEVVAKDNSIDLTLSFAGLDSDKNSVFKWTASESVTYISLVCNDKDFSKLYGTQDDEGGTSGEIRFSLPAKTALKCHVETADKTGRVFRSDAVPVCNKK